MIAPRPRVADRAARDADGARERRRRHRDARPEQLEELVARDDALALAQQMTEQRERLRLDRDAARRRGAARPPLRRTRSDRSGRSSHWRCQDGADRRAQPTSTRPCARRSRRSAGRAGACAARRRAKPASAEHAARRRRAPHRAEPVAARRQRDRHAVQAGDGVEERRVADSRRPRGRGWCRRCPASGRRRPARSARAIAASTVGGTRLVVDRVEGGDQVEGGLGAQVGDVAHLEARRCARPRSRASARADCDRRGREVVAGEARGREGSPPARSARGRCRSRRRARRRRSRSFATRSGTSGRIASCSAATTVWSLSSAITCWKRS